MTPIQKRAERARAISLESVLRLAGARPDPSDRHKWHLAREVLSALRRLKLWTLLQGFRGKPAADVDALVDAAVHLGDQFLACPDLQELELNPVIVHARGAGLVVVDSLAVASSGEPG